MALTITLTPALILVGLYALVGFGLLVAGLMERSRFAEPRYHEPVLIGIFWPIWILQIPYAKIRGDYIVSDYKKLKKRYTQWRCNHSDIEDCGDYTINGKTPDKTCPDCAKTWWE